MEIGQTLMRGHELAGMSTPKGKPDVPQAHAAAAPADGVRVTASESAKKTTVSDTEVKQALDEINRFITPANGNIEFAQDADTGKTLVKIIDTQTKTVIRQIPSKEAVEIAKELNRLQGLLVREKA
jgi:flagellar protein FlaG